jgi:hypothetical protein
LQGREELDGFQADLRPGELGSAHEHAFIEGYTAVDLGPGGEAVLVADLEVEWLVGQRHVEGEKRGRFPCLVGGAMTLDFDHVELGESV